MHGCSAIRIVLIAAAALAMAVFAPQSAAAATIYPWCLHDSGGWVRCGFTSEQACRQARIGNSDMCMLNGLYFRNPVRAQDIPAYLPPIRERGRRR
ncbi:MAG: DUF3551 domain-containing protein [Pseudorhodoplanes sp.]|jgi:hypothetical protein|nr:DUF3551 domain-containing protein [Pseudorhodoplanes sp.]